eukprot:TRINITY_DN2269_c0_g1_i7.p5 TRINITY_DN2269_c0_g1~~TRINITY_DN2269_c0_g1_i7.p5  ORF type:complete len:100 (-),score=3.57 TRINITY_DN2269_c0_g1_i7:893-1192(-)
MWCACVVSVFDCYGWTAVCSVAASLAALSASVFLPFYFVSSTLWTLSSSGPSVPGRWLADVFYACLPPSSRRFCASRHRHCVCTVSWWVPSSSCCLTNF